MTDSLNTQPKLVQGPVNIGLLRLTAPVILGITAYLVAGLLEIFFLAQVSIPALAAYSFTFPVSGALLSVILGIGIGLSSVLARTVGSGEHDQTRRLASDGIGLMALIMILISIVGLLTIEPLFVALGADDTTLPLIVDYMSVYYWSLLFLAVPSLGASALRAIGDASTSGIIMVSGAILHIIISPFLIFGLLGLPELGLKGAAWANLIASFVLFVVTMSVLHFKEHLLSYSNITAQMVLHSWRRILAVGIPATATNLIGPISIAIIVSLLAGYSQETVAGFGIASRIEALSVIPLYALSASIGPFVGQNEGAHRHDRADLAMLLSYRFSLVWGVLVALLLILFRQEIASFFDNDPAVISVTATYLLLVPVSYAAWGVLMMSNAIFNSLDKPLSSTIMSIVRMFVLYVPLAFASKALFGLNGIFAAATVSNILAGLIAYTWNRKTYRDT